MKEPSGGVLEIPILATRRLLLRAHRTEDLPAMTEMWSDPEVTRFLNTHPLTPEECWGRLLRYYGHWYVMGYGYWAIEDRITGAFVGEAGFANYRRSTDPPMDISPEAGWVLSKNHHGKGYATEIAEALVRWGRGHFGEIPLRCIIHPEHPASLRVAQKCGFVVATTLHYKGSPAVLLELPVRLLPKD